MTDAERERGPTLDLKNLHQTVCNLIALETQSYWQINSAHLVGLTVLAGFLSKPAQGWTENLYALFASLLGLGIGLSWYGCIQRSNAWHDFRVKQARDIENGWAHKPVTDAMEFRANKGWSIRSAMRTLACAFTLGFALLAGVSLYKMICSL